MDEKDKGLEGKWSTTSGKVYPKYKRHVLSKELAALFYVGADQSAECQICCIRFSSSSNLKRHLHRFRDRKYPCDECGTKFSNPEILRSHIRHAHESVRLKTYKGKCPVCSQRFPLETYLQSHLCHYHGEWINTKLSTFASKSSTDETETGSAVKNSEGRQTTTKRSRKRYVIELVKDIVRTTSKDHKETTLSNGENTRLESLNDSYWESGAIRNNLLDESVSNLSAVAKACNNVQKQAWNRTEQPTANWRSGSEVHRDTALRILYSCKDCYVPLTRINTTKSKTPMKPTHLPSTYRAVNTVSSGKMKRRVKQSRKKRYRQRHQQERKKIRHLKLTNFEMPLVTFLNTDDVLKSETDDYKMTHEPSDALQECVDPLDIGHEPIENNCTVDESSRELTIGTLAEQSIPIAFPMKTEAVNSVVAVPFFSFINPQSGDLPAPCIPFKGEPMDCGVEEDSTATMESYTVLDDESVPCTDALDTSMKIEIEEHPISGHWDHETICDAIETESLEVLDENSPQIETNTSSGCEEEQIGDTIAQGQTSQMMIASKICNSRYASRRAMLRHFRDIHLTCFGDTVRCTCGKEMIGRRALENHFSRYCDRVIRTSLPESNPRNPCKMLDKKYMCDKCGERFWLESCLHDHPPNCELPKTAPPNRNRLTQNLHQAHGIASHLGDTREYVCRICQAKFMSVEKLLCHVRTFTSKERYPCPVCWTVFPGARLLKGHIQSTHTQKCLTMYPFSCNICHQGFTKKHYQRVHMMHIHSKVIKRSSNVGVPTECRQVSPVAAENATGNQCSVCNLVFASHKRFVDHTSYYNKTEVFRCNTCGEAFVGQYKVHHHRKKVHYTGSMKTTYTHHCNICKEGFMYKTHLHAHMVHVHGIEYNSVIAPKNNVRSEENGQSIDDKFTCSSCPKKFSTASLLRDHLGLHQSDGEKPKNAGFKCCQCGMEFLNWSGWNFHLKNAHPTADPVDTSSLRTKSNDTISTGPVDTSSLHTKRNVTISTDSVDTSSLRAKRNATITADSTDSSVDNSVSSGNCDGLADPSTGVLTPRRTDEIANPEQSTSGMIRFNRDILTAMNDVKSSLCTICGYNCPGPGGLSKHNATYVNSGMYICEFCGRRFRWQSYCRDHKLKHFRRDVHNDCFCPVCDEGFENVQCLEMHTIHLHQQRLDRLVHASRQDLSRTGESTCENGAKTTLCGDGHSTDSNDPLDIITLDNVKPGDKSPDSTRYLTTCKICRMVFVNNEKLKSHLKSYHSVLDEKVSTTRKQVSNATGDRFYVLDGDNIDSNTLYRYDASLTCKDCDLTFASARMLNVHHEILHKIRTNFEFASVNVDGHTQPSQAKAVEVSSRSHMARGHVELGSSGAIAESHTKANAESKTRTEAPKKVERSRAGNINDSKISQATHHNKVVNSYQCRDCDIIFVDKNHLSAHERIVHNLITRDDERSNHQWSRQFRAIAPKVDESIDKAKRDICSTTQRPVILRPITVSYLEPASVIKLPEEITISDDDTGDSGELSTTAKNQSCSAKSRRTQPMRLVQLPPGKYTIAKLKVRSADTAVGKAMQKPLQD